MNIFKVNFWFNNNFHNLKYPQEIEYSIYLHYEFIFSLQ